MKRGLWLPQRLLAGLLCLALVVALPGLALAAPPIATATLGIYATSGMVGRYADQNPITGEVEPVSYLKVATAIKRERMAIDTTLLFDVGNSMPTGQMAVIDEMVATSMAAVLRSVGYTGMVPGVGEFAYQPEVRDTLFHALSSADGVGVSVGVLSANYMDKKGQTPRLTPYQIHTISVGSREFRVGVLALSAMDTVQRVPTPYLEGSTFFHEGNELGSMAWEWNNHWQEQLRTTEQCDFVVVATTGDANSLYNLVTTTTGIDLVLGGEAGMMTLENRVGKEIHCLGGSGSDLTKTVITLSSDGAISAAQSELIALADQRSDTALEQQLSTASNRVAEAAVRPIGILTGDWAEQTGYSSIQNKTADLVGSAMVWAAGTDLALVSTGWLGTLRPADLFGSEGARALVTRRDCQRIYPDPSSSLCVVAVTGAQLKLLLEQSAVAYEITSTRSVAGGGGADLLYGANYELYLGNQPTTQVTSLTVAGRTVADTQVLRVAMEYSRLLESPLMADDYKILWRAATSRDWAATGGSVASVLAGYVKHQTDQVGYVESPAEHSRYVYAGASASPITRLEFISMLYEMAGSPIPAASVAFIDVEDSDAVVWAAENRISNGDGKGRFLPAQLVTKEQAAVMLHNYAKLMGLKTPTVGTAASTMLDYGDIATWARAAVDYCCRTGVISGQEAGRFFPRENLTRAQASVAVQRFGSLLRGM